MRMLLQRPALLTLALADSVSSVGDWITMLAVFALIIFRGDGTVAQSSGIFLASLLPMLLASPAAGWLCDRFDRKWLMIASQAGNGFVCLGLVFARDLTLIYGLLALEAVLISVIGPARQAALPDIVSAEELPRANALLRQIAGVIKMVAPMLAGGVLAVLSPHDAILLDVASFWVSALILSRLPALAPRQAFDREAGHAPAPDLLGTLRGSPGLQWLFVTAFLTTTILIGFDVLSAVVTRDLLDGGEQLYGLLVGLVGAGTIGAAAVLMARRRPGDPWRDVVAGLALLMCLPAGVAVATYMPTPALARTVLAAGCLLGGIGDGLAIVQLGTLVQQLSPAAMLGRVGGLVQAVLVAGQLLGMVLTPLLAPAPLSIGQYFTAGTVALGLLTIALALHRRAGPVQDARVAI